MIDKDAALFALRAPALSLVAATTGAIAMSATTSGFVRATGSFIDDGFRVGMELLASSFTKAANNGTKTVLAVTDTLITVVGCVAEVSAAGKTLLVGLPELRAWEDVDFTPIAGRPFIEEDLVPATSAVLSAPANGGIVEETGLYVLRLYLPSGTGGSALRRIAGQLVALYAPGTVISAAGNAVLRVRSDVGPNTGQLLPQGDGWTLCTISIPWRAQSFNTIAA